MDSDGYNHLKNCIGPLTNSEDCPDYHGLTMRPSLLPTAGSALTGSPANLATRLFRRESHPEHRRVVTGSDFSTDLKFGIKAFMNDNCVTPNNDDSTTPCSNSLPSDDEEEEGDDNDSGIVTSTTSATAEDRVDGSSDHTQASTVAYSMTAGSDNNDDSDDSRTSTSTTISYTNSGSYSGSVTASSSKGDLFGETNGPRKLRFAVGQDVLARWNDGLFYLGNILKIDERALKCYVQFEDNSEFWVLFKDIQRGAKEGEIMCCLCQGELSDVPDEIVLCDNCGLGYHQLCHNPPIDTNVLNPDVEWLCRLCVFASTVKRGGALKSGPNAQALQLMKQSLPYDMNMLTWDTQHKTNLEQSYCYCGGPGDWYLKMLQCCRCRMWFHEACIQCLDQPLLYGDRFYLFVCSFCNSGPEYLKRIQLKWVDIAQLALFNLCISYQKKYYDLDKVVMPWVYLNRENLQLDTHLETHLRHEIKDKILETLRSHKKRFQCGREIKKSRSLWGLRLRLPPSPPTIDLPIEGQITDEVMNNLQMKGRKTKTFVPVECQSPIRLKRKTPSVVSDDSLHKSKKPTLNGSKRNRVPLCTLDKIIPPLSNFDGPNHPFKTDLEQRLESEKQKLKQKLLALYENGFDPSERHLVDELRALNPQAKPTPKQRGRRKAGAPKPPPAPVPIASQALRAPGPGTETDPQDPKGGCAELRRRHCLEQSLKELAGSSVGNYFGVVGRLTRQETFEVLARRQMPGGEVQYLVQWEGMLS